MRSTQYNFSLFVQAFYQTLVRDISKQFDKCYRENLSSALNTPCKCCRDVQSKHYIKYFVGTKTHMPNIRRVLGELSHGYFSNSMWSEIVTSRPGPLPHPGLDSILARYCPLWAYHSLTVLFLGTHTRTSQWVTHHGIALARYSLNFGVPTEPEASELPKGLVLGRDVNIHIRITPLGNVRSHRNHLDLNIHPTQQTKSHNITISSISYNTDFFVC